MANVAKNGFQKSKGKTKFTKSFFIGDMAKNGFKIG